MFDGGGFITPPPSQAGDNVPIVAIWHARSAICKFTIDDFTPDAPAPNPYLRQSIGEYLPWLHNCGESTCLFTEPPFEMWQMALQSSMLLPNSELSPGDHIHVDKRAFRSDMHMKVKLEVLDCDPGLWGGLGGI
jgi:hypothetical protein